MCDRLLSYRARSDLLAKRIILVTGAADGIGRAVARTFAQHGASLILLDRKSRKLEVLYDEIVDAGWPEPALVARDLAGLDGQGAWEVGAGIEHDFQRLDGIVHNAAQLSPLTPLHSYHPADWNSTLQVNLTAPFLLTQALFPLLKLSDSASVIFSSAQPGRQGQAYWGAYAVAYGGIEILMQTWAEEVEHNTRIRMNTLDPGAVRTRMRDLAYPGETKGSLRTPEDITNAYLYLMGEDSRHIRGQSISLA